MGLSILLICLLNQIVTPCLADLKAPVTTFGTQVKPVRHSTPSESNGKQNIVLTKLSNLTPKDDLSNSGIGVLDNEKCTLSKEYSSPLVLQSTSKGLSLPKNCKSESVSTKPPGLTKLTPKADLFNHGVGSSSDNEKNTFSNEHVSPLLLKSTSKCLPVPKIGQSELDSFNPLTIKDSLSSFSLPIPKLMEKYVFKNTESSHPIITDKLPIRPYIVPSAYPPILTPSSLYGFSNSFSPEGCALNSFSQLPTITSLPLVPIESLQSNLAEYSLPYPLHYKSVTNMKPLSTIMDLSSSRELRNPLLERQNRLHSHSSFDSVSASMNEVNFSPSNLQPTSIIQSATVLIDNNDSNMDYISSYTNPMVSIMSKNTVPEINPLVSSKEHITSSDITTILSKLQSLGSSSSFNKIRSLLKSKLSATTECPVSIKELLDLKKSYQDEEYIIEDCLIPNFETNMNMPLFSTQYLNNYEAKQFPEVFMNTCIPNFDSYEIPILNNNFDFEAIVFPESVTNPRIPEFDSPKVPIQNKYFDFEPLAFPKEVTNPIIPDFESTNIRTQDQYFDNEPTGFPVVVTDPHVPELDFPTIPVLNKYFDYEPITFPEVTDPCIPEFDSPNTPILDKYFDFEPIVFPEEVTDPLLPDFDSPNIPILNKCFDYEPIRFSKVVTEPHVPELDFPRIPVLNREFEYEPTECLEVSTNSRIPGFDSSNKPILCQELIPSLPNFSESNMPTELCNTFTPSTTGSSCSISFPSSINNIPQISSTPSLLSKFSFNIGSTIKEIVSSLSQDSLSSVRSYLDTAIESILDEPMRRKRVKSLYLTPTSFSCNKLEVLPVPKITLPVVSSKISSCLHGFCPKTSLVNLDKDIPKLTPISLNDYTSPRICPKYLPSPSIPSCSSLPSHLFIDPPTYDLQSSIKDNEETQRLLQLVFLSELLKDADNINYEALNSMLSLMTMTS